MRIVRDIVVIGAPVGGAAALIEIAKALPSDLQASIFVVLHAQTDHPILLADALSAPGRLRVTDAVDGEPIEQRRIYVAADGKHLRISGDRVVVSVDAGESACCPSIDVLFRSAAEAHDGRVVGIVLLHTQTEGSDGLLAIRQRGGRTITHQNDGMRDAPRHARSGELLSDHHVELERIGERVIAYVHGENGAAADTD